MDRLSLSISGTSTSRRRQPRIANFSRRTSSLHHPGESNHTTRARQTIQPLARRTANTRQTHDESKTGATTTTTTITITMRPHLTGLRAPLRPSTTVTHTPTLTAARPLSTTPALSARLIRRPRRPYTFTQLVQLSDGSTYTCRTTSPHPMHKSTKDTRNHVLWQPTDRSLQNVELDEAGRLAAFRGRYGRGFDIQEGEEGAEAKEEGVVDLGELISGYAGETEQKKK